VSVWAAVVPAAGASTRMGRDKTLADLDGAPVLVRSLRLLRAAGLRRLAVGIRAGAAARVREVLERHDLGGAALVVGGAARAETVAACLAALDPEVTHVLVHDAARPYCSPDLVRRVMAAAEEAGAACAALPVVDTIHRAAPDGTIAAALDRSVLWQAQTPQGFRRDILERAHACAPAGTDDAGMVAALGAPVRLVEGERGNVKLTFAEDLAPVPGPALAAPVRVGYGHDVHRLVAGRPLILGGVRIPHDRGLDGHSDADALAHAVCDAVLGAAGLADIGTHFPPSDARWKGADSLDLLRRCVAICRQAGWRPAQADCLVAAERPRLAPHAGEMRRRLAEALDLPPGP
jgi:2-C-methyl-D-erythritol 4-phosphate cytidylyltransferase/2-C-methyl-D-erythritol 2,4-cyclodiphosphate synthase